MYSVDQDAVLRRLEMLSELGSFEFVLGSRMNSCVVIERLRFVNEQVREHTRPLAVKQK
jgi:hypothetical protein